ncbi:hypothetical protein [Mucilaginibacter sp.]
MDVILRVPVKRFVLKYITAKFKLQPGEAWRIGRLGKENTIICCLLERTPNRYEKYLKNEAILDIIIPENINLKKGAFLSQDSINVFTGFIKDSLLEEINLYYFGIKNGQGLKRCEKVVAIVHKEDKVKQVRLKTEEGKKFYAQNNTIYDILEKYNITPSDLTFDSIVKHIQRYA